MRVYLDLVMVLNGLVDFLLLLGTNRLGGFPTDLKRTVSAAALGSLYSGACFLPGFHFLGNTLWRLVSLTGMAGLAFGWDRTVPRRCALFVLLSMALGGMALAMETVDGYGLLLCAGGLWLLCRFLPDGSVGMQQYVPLELTYGQNRVKVTALRDTGNTLRDPITGEQVLILSGSMATRLTGLTQAQLRDPLGTLGARPLPGLRLIPYRAVGQSGGMLLAMRLERVRIGNREQCAVVAFSPEGLGQGEAFQALTGGML